MADLRVNFAGISSPNPFWLASAPPTNSGYQVMRAFEAGWGGVVWKTLTDKPIVNTTSRFAGLRLHGQRMVGFNNIELISDRPLADNLREIAEVKRRFPDRAVIASIMIEPKRDLWHEVIKRTQDAGVDGFELNFGCPHGMAERGMGAAVGQHPDLVKMQTEWAKEAATVPVIAKLTPNITDIRVTAQAARAGGADAVSMINTINSLMGVDLNTWNTIPHIDGRGAHGGYCGPAVKPIALHMVAECAKDPLVGIPISGMGGISDWRDAVEFMLMGSTSVQVCTAVMHHGFRIVEDMLDGLNNYLDDKGILRAMDLVGQATGKYGDWNRLNLRYQTVAKIDEDTCIRCNKCYVACEDSAHQAIQMIANKEDGKSRYHLEVVRDECVGCNLCYEVCPVDGCITMEVVDNGLDAVTWSDLQDTVAHGNR
ncbi:NAD-dependent dihydropyrimidine dehydrogenase subunit PreA [Alicyclobacillus acidoterrestris]|uniref:Dihydrothymine dehydrogenase n=1 Tax=Alicyclobacillus acidoterrestris (strain ATCC 49025 / DSM 3922 / CIP 106132 / NCIMB 13137 / GD3B) TaxID=1356854 RepID=T0BZ74_ALIAG|nr:NAD-dependent dihydropyrimidine dehydrogenase subunit PreA [Alicyclobacillus acidoterrestris]EPZ45710.1 hypothetical protein N007_08010 [Alicyclobacillus acidoterrestris ATCC 49025]UNO50014.1 NAD-dependent dihydropyrimidine dehydrogenase subunit PreA [Alicyclobacillus acidoterrestris]